MECQKFNKGLLSLTLFFILLNISSFTIAAPMGNPAQATITQFNDTPFSISLETDIISERKIKFPLGVKKGNIEGFWYAAKMSYTWFDMVDTYLLFGAMGWDLNYSNVKVTTKREPAYGLGVKTLLFETESGIALGMDLRYRQQEPDVKKIKEGDNTFTPTRTILKDFREWQVALAVSCDLNEYYESNDACRIIPYVGVKYSQLAVDLSGGDSRGRDLGIDDGEAEDTFGAFLGIDFYFTEVPKDEEIGLNLEMRFIDETAYSISINYKL